jgi:hypothetical protein
MMGDIGRFSLVMDTLYTTSSIETTQHETKWTQKMAQQSQDAGPHGLTGEKIVLHAGHIVQSATISLT